MNDTERDARIVRIAECFQHLHQARERENMHGIAFWATELARATAVEPAPEQPPTPLITKCSTAECGFDAWINFCHKHYVEALEAYKHENAEVRTLRQQATNAANRADQAASRAETAAMRADQAATRSETFAGEAENTRKFAQQLTNRAEQACARAEAATKHRR